jgi:hypothetical protein
MNSQEFDADLQQHLSVLAREKQPERDLWQGIELALASDAAANQLNDQTIKAGGNKLHLLAAAFAIFGLIGWLSINQQTNLLSGDDLVASLSEQHQQQKSALLVEFKDQPALTENWQDQLKEMDEAAEAIKLALVNEPNNMPLLKMLQTVHQQQINLIERVHSPKWSQI